ncbi:hypothetical protein ANANG_G00059510 [Anguilla anguilla]|uniref:Uncharacterized protein n=1 Tax=Anguilla anguilla TaxID=7936 RepID=A0A9D3S2F5_ANGAN|nr:hypothetical protein ANANG_G00059510 [Anguilla anguilla]
MTPTPFLPQPSRQASIQPQSLLAPSSPAKTEVRGADEGNRSCRCSRGAGGAVFGLLGSTGVSATSACEPTMGRKEHVWELRC